MENNEDTNTNMMDLLPNEMVIEIFEHFEDFADLSTLPKVNYRFNVLSKLKCDRNHLLYKDDRSATYSNEEIRRKMEEEINKCTDLKAMTVTSYRAHLLLRNECRNLLRSIFINAMNRNTGHEIDEDDDIDTLIMSNDECYLYSIFKKNADDIRDVVQIAPSSINYINAIGVPKLFLTAIEKSTDTLVGVTYKGTNLTLAHLNALGKCKNLDMVWLTGKLVVSEEIPKTFNNIQAKEIWLKGNFYCPYVADLFFSESLETLKIVYCTIAQFKNELFNKCTNLKFLHINMELERDDMQNHHLIDSITELVDTLKHHQTLRHINIFNLSQYIGSSLDEPLSASLEAIPGARMYSFNPDIYITL